MSEPMEHIERLRPPWRTIRLTECGHELSEFKSVLTREEAVAKFKKQGTQRAGLSTCMTCCSRVNYSRGETWEANPAALVSRDVNGRREDLLAGELRALALLWEAHQDEYAAIVEGLHDLTDLTARREAKRAGAAYVRNSSAKPPKGA